MYRKVKGGSKEVIQGHTCYLPPQPRKQDMGNYGLRKKEQYWRRTPLPTFKAGELEIWSGTSYDPDDTLSWDDAYREELIKRSGIDIYDIGSDKKPKKVRGIDVDPYYFSRPMEEFRRQEFFRIQYGYWFLNNGKPTFITGDHYFFLNWWKMDHEKNGGYGDYRETDREFFYVIDWVRNHPTMLGLIYITVRGEGKSYKAGCIAYLEAVRGTERHCGMQSKTESDAQKLFRNKICAPAVNLPEFLKFVNAHKGNFKALDKIDFSGPKGRGNMDVRYFNLLRNQAGISEKEGFALNSMIDYRNSSEYSYDSSTLAFLIQDEVGKPSEADVVKRWDVNKDCLERNSEKRGFSLVTSTVDEKGLAPVKKLWDRADISNGEMTPDSLTRMFTSALDCTSGCIDRYGFPDRAKARELHEAKRNSYRAIGDDSGLARHIKKQPYTAEEAFRGGNEKCYFNEGALIEAQRITEELEFNSSHPYLVGDFEWEGEPFNSDVKFVQQRLGKWHIRTRLVGNSILKPNQVIKKGSQWEPMNGSQFRGGLDPVRFAANEKKYSSDVAGWIGSMPGCALGEEYANTAIADFIYENPDTPEMALHEFMKGLWYFGAPFLPETNLGNVRPQLKVLKCDKFVLNRPQGSKPNQDRKATMEEKGMRSDAHTVDYQLARGKSFVSKYGHKLRLPRTIDALLSYNHLERFKCDLGVAILIGVAGRDSDYHEPQEELDLSQIFRLYDHRGQNAI